MNKTLIAIMVVATIGMIWGLAKQKAGVMMGKHVATICALIALVCALMQIFSGSGPNPKKIMERHLAFTKVEGQYLGKHLAEKYNGAKVLLIVNPTIPGMPEQDNTLLEAIKEGMGSAVTIVAEVAPEIPKNMLPPEMPGAPGGAAPGGKDAPPMPPPMMMGPMDMWLTPEAFNKMIKPHAGKYDMLITMIGLPMQSQNLDIWKAKPPPKVVIASGMIQEFKAHIANKFIVACLTFNPKAVNDDKGPSGKLDEDFNKRYLLITPENVTQVATDNPMLFIDMQPQK